mgnify:CR=1 FL=1
MPIAFRRDATHRFCLKADEQRPDEERVYIKARFLTYAEREQVYAKLIEANKKETSDADSVRLLWEALGIGVIGPDGAKTPDGRDVPCTLEGVKMVLSASELWELATEYPNAVSLGEADLKKSASSTQESAKGAE